MCFDYDKDRKNNMNVEECNYADSIMQHGPTEPTYSMNKVQ